MHLRRSLAVLAVCLGLMSLPVASAQVTANIYMSVAPDGPQTDVIRSGTAVVYVVLDYQDASQTELRIEVIGNGNVELFRHAQRYSGSGRENVAVTGEDLFEGYRARAAENAQTLVEAIDQALESSSASAMRFRTSAAVATAITLDIILGSLERYRVSLEVADRLEEARDWVQQTRVLGENIMNITQVPDDELVARLTEMRELAVNAQTTTQAALDAMVTGVARPILDGSYTTELLQSGYPSQSVEWEVRPDGTPGTPVPPTPTPTPSLTATPPATASPTPGETPLVPTVTRPPFTATVSPTATPTPTRPAATPTAGGPSIPLPPTATMSPGVPIAPAEPTASATPTTMPVAVVPTQPSPAVGTPVVVAPVQVATERPAGEASEPVGGPTPEAAERVFPSVTEPLPPQETAAFPVQRVAALVGALLLGMLALWLRTRL